MLLLQSIPRGRRAGAGLALTLTICVAVIAQACTAAETTSTPAPASPVTLTIGFPFQTGVDPLHGANQVARLLSREGLTVPTRDGRALPRLAESWTVGADGLQWTIQLRKNAFFHDGSPVDAASVKESLERSLTPAEIALAPGLGDILSIEAPAPDRVLIRLRDRSTFLLDDLALAITKATAKGMVGSGPFVTASTTETEVVMSAVPNYYRGKPNIDRVVIRAYPTIRTAWAAMMRGEVDFLYEAGPEAVEFMKGEASVTVFPMLRNYASGIIVNSERPPFNEWKIRRALNYAVDRQALVEQVLKGHGVPAVSAAWPEHWAYDSSAMSLSYNPTRAIALLDQVPATAHQLARPDGPPSRFRFSCLIPEGFAVWERMALMVQRSLSVVGVDMQLESVSFEDYNKRIETGEFQSVFMEFVIGNSPSRAVMFWHSKSLRNQWGYNNPFMDKRLDEIRHAANDAAYREAFRHFQNESADSPPAVFLVLSELARVVSKRFEVVALPGVDILRTIPDWRLAQDAPRSTN